MATTPVGAATRKLTPRDAVSAGVLNSLAVHNGSLKPAAGRPLPANPSIFPNVRASNLGSQPANETPVATDPTNDQHLLTGSNDYNCSSIQGFYTSDNEGFAWPHQHCLTTLSGLSGFGDPATAYDTSGTAYIAGIDATGSLTNGQIVFQSSTDNGVTWSATKKAVGATFSNGLTDKEWMEADHTASSPFAGCLYISITQFDSTFTKTQISVSHSCDGGTTWTTTFASTVANSPVVNQFSDIGIGADGTVYATWMQCTAGGSSGDCGGQPFTMFISKSTDGGMTWSAASSIATGKLAPDDCFCAYYGNKPKTSERVSDIPVVDVDRSSNVRSGYVYDTYYNWTGTFMQVLFTYSSDGGTTWATPIVVQPTNTHDQWFQWVAVNDVSGQVGLTFWNSKDDPSNVKYAPWVAFWRSRGAPFKKQFALSTTLSDPFKDGFGGGFFGDYSSSAWTDVALQLQYCSTLFTSNCQNTWTGVNFGA